MRDPAVGIVTKPCAATLKRLDFIASKARRYSQNVQTLSRALPASNKSINMKGSFLWGKTAET
jgi:hypothetical protein